MLLYVGWLIAGVFLKKVEGEVIWSAVPQTNESIIHKELCSGTQNYE